MITYKLSDLLTIMQKGQKALFGGFYFWFSAEIHKIKEIQERYHMELVEIDDNNTLIAKIKAIIFDQQSVNDFVAKTGMNVDQREGVTLTMEGSFNFHKDYGASIIIKSISPILTKGNINQQKNLILNQLQQLGIVNHNKSLIRAYPPYKIALITGNQSQGANDFVSILQQSPYYFSIHTYPSAIHGNKAKQEVLQQLQKIQQDQKKGAQYTHVAIVRGGGESSGMMRQNDKEIAQQICYLDIPVIVAIGHTEDVTVLDHIVNMSAKTPSNAAHFLVEKLDEYKNKIDTMHKTIQTALIHQIQLATYKVETMKKTIDQNMLFSLQTIKNNIHTRYTHIKNQSPEILKDKGYGILKYNNQYLAKNDLKKLQRGDTLTIDIYDRTITVTIKHL